MVERLYVEHGREERHRCLSAVASEAVELLESRRALLAEKGNAAQM